MRSKFAEFFLKSVDVATGEILGLLNDFIARESTAEGTH
jgi:hypothetical protein